VCPNRPPRCCSTQAGRHRRARAACSVPDSLRTQPNPKKLCPARRGAAQADGDRRKATPGPPLLCPKHAPTRALCRCSISPLPPAACGAGIRPAPPPPSPPYLHQAIQRALIELRAAHDRPLVHHPRPHHVHRVGGDGPSQPAGETGTTHSERGERSSSERGRPSTQAQESIFHWILRKAFSNPRWQHYLLPPRSQAEGEPGHLGSPGSSGKGSTRLRLLQSLARAPGGVSTGQPAAQQASPGAVKVTQT